MPSYIENPKFKAVLSEMESACHCARAYDSLLAEYAAKYGAQGSYISGAGRAHFPTEVKDHLRRVALAVKHHSDLAYAARPKHYAARAVRMLGQEVARRDGSGFYGPQA